MEFENVEMSDPPSFEEVCETIKEHKGDLDKKSLKDDYSPAIFVTSLEDPEKFYHFSARRVLRKLGLIDKKIGEQELTPRQLEILLTLLDKDTWLNPGDIQRYLAETSIMGMGTAGIRKAIKQMDELLDIKDEGTKKQNLYKTKPKQDQETFLKLVNLFHSLTEFEEFTKTNYCQNNQKNMVIFEEKLEERMKRLKEKTFSLFCSKEEYESYIEQLRHPSTINNKNPFLQNYELLINHWLKMHRIWRSIGNNICKNCQYKEECLKSKTEKYGDYILERELESAKRLEEPGSIVSTYCGTIMRNLRDLQDRIRFLKNQARPLPGDFKEIIDYSQLDELIKEYLQS